MNPSSYIRILVDNLSIRFPNAAKPPSSSSTIHPSTPPFYCKIKLSDFPSQNSTIPFDEHEEDDPKPLPSSPPGACFTLEKKVLEKIVNGSSILVEVYAYGLPNCDPWRDKGKMIGKVRVPLCSAEMMKMAKEEGNVRSFYLHSGWVEISSKAQLRLYVKVESDPRYVFEFGSKPERSPQVFQVQGNSNKQAVFTCKFALRNPIDRVIGSRPSIEVETKKKQWLSSLRREKWKVSRERKGWTVTVHDLSGSPVAMASMVTPFVASPGSNRVSPTSPGAWLILQPSYGGWKPWGRLEAWRDQTNSVGYRFNLFNETGIATSDSTLASSSISAKHGGLFVIDTTISVATPLPSPQSSYDFGSVSPLAHFGFKGFVMSATVEPSGRPVLEVGAQHVGCTEDAAAFVALAAALDLSVDACTLFTRRLRRELRQQITQSLEM